MNNQTKKIISYGVLSLTIIMSITYFIFTLLNSDNNINPLEPIINSFILSILSVFFVLTSLFIVNSRSRAKLYMYITSGLLTLLLAFNLITETQLLKLPQPELVNDFTNISISDALVWASSNEIQVEQVYEPSDTVPMNHIINQTVTAGTLTKDVTKISFTISTGPNYDKQIVVPNMLGWDIDEVIKYINENFLNNVTIEYELSSEPKDIIIFQDKNGLLRRSDAIKLTFSLGSKDDLVPLELIDFTNQKLFDATLWLKRNGFKYNLTYEFNDKVERHRVVTQDKVKGTVVDPNKDTINLTISKGKKIIVPDLLKMDITEVTQWIMDNNLAIKFSDKYDDKIAIGKLISANYKAGAEIEEGTLITVITSRGQLKMEEFSSLYDFRTWANKYNVKYQETYEFNDTVASGEVISYSYEKNQVIKNDAVISVVVSQGKPVTIPNFVGKSKTYISSTCKSIGLSCSYTYGSYSSVKKDYALYQSKSSGREVISGTSLLITLSKGPAQKFTLILQETLYTYGSADSSIKTLQSYVATYYPGVIFSIIKKPDNTSNSGMPHPDSPAQTGMTVEQGKTYTIWVVE